MAIQAIKRWQWILLSLVIGIAMGLLQRMPRPDWARAYGQSLTQAEFEEAIASQTNGVRHFTDLFVFLEHVQDVDGGTRPIHVVAGRYFNGRPEMRDGQLRRVWHPRCFIAEVPFRPLAQRDGAVDPKSTVMTYLDRAKGARYRYAWWRDPHWALTIWTGVSVLVIGLIWPTLINLLVFGSIFRPRGERGIDLSKVTTASAQPDAGPSLSEQDLDAIKALESKLMTSASEPPAVTEPVREVPLRQLTTTELESTSDQIKEKKAFGADEDDFYPTERKAHP